jgi:hypothetical protein
LNRATERAQTLKDSNCAWILSDDSTPPNDEIDTLTRVFDNADCEIDPDEVDIQVPIEGMVNHNRAFRTVPVRMSEAWTSYCNQVKQDRAREVHLSELRNYVDTGNYKAAIATMKQRSVLTVTKDDTVNITDPTVYMLCVAQSLDYLSIWGGVIGLSAVCGSAMAELHIDTSHAGREFSTKHGHFRFDPTGRFICIGEYRGMRVFLVLAPEEYFEVEISAEKWENCKTSTTMNVAHQRAMKVFISYALSSLGIGIHHSTYRQKDVSLVAGKPACLNTIGNFYEHPR